MWICVDLGARLRRALDRLPAAAWVHVVAATGDDQGFFVTLVQGLVAFGEATTGRLSSGPASPLHNEVAVLASFRAELKRLGW
jgi:hypothetical protein